MFFLSAFSAHSAVIPRGTRDCLPAEHLPRMITWMLGRKEVKVALLFPTVAVDNLDRFRGGDHNLHHRTTADSRKPL
jgi:hypothetical protein